ncbi:MAG: glycosyltransferase family 2 protein [bacterium]
MAGLEIESQINIENKVQLDIVIVNYDSGHHLVDCLTALNMNNGAANGCQIIVYDNGSSDSSLQHARSSFPNVRYIGNHTNLGFAAAVNRVAQILKSKYLLLLNPDVVIFPNTLDLMFKFMEQHPKCGILGGEILSPLGFRQHTCRKFPHYFNVPFGRRSLARRVFPNNTLSNKYLYLNLDSGYPQKVDFVEGSLMMIRRVAAGQVRFFDEGFFLYLEDADLCYRIKERGWETWWLPESYAIHYRGENFRADNVHPAMHHSRGFYRFFNKHYKPSAPLKLLLRAFLSLRLVYVISTECIKKVFHDTNFSPRC